MHLLRREIPLKAPRKPRTRLEQKKARYQYSVCIYFVEIPLKAPRKPRIRSEWKEAPGERNSNANSNRISRFWAGNSIENLLRRCIFVRGCSIFRRKQRVGNLFGARRTATWTTRPSITPYFYSVVCHYPFQPVITSQQIARLMENR